jgi:hypothetical protein
MKCQFTLTVSEGKRLIAKGIASLPSLRKALDGGLILLKGGTTVSALSEELCGRPLRISGRITPRGTVSSGSSDVEDAHSILLRKGVPEKADGRLAEIGREMGPDDVAVCGANLVDHDGNAVMMAGRDLCGEPGSVIPSLESEGVLCMVAAGLEKFSPYPVRESCHFAGRKSSSWAMGMAVGLVPVPGRVFSEMDALLALGADRCMLVGRGGICGAEGASTFVVEGDARRLKELLKLVLSLKGAEESGSRSSLTECIHCGPNRTTHLACIYGGCAEEEGTWKGVSVR